MFEQAFKNIDDVLWKDAGCTSELDYTEQTSWLLFLKYLDTLEHDKATEAALESKKYTHILDVPYRWETWAAPADSRHRRRHRAKAWRDHLRPGRRLGWLPLRILRLPPRPKPQTQHRPGPRPTGAHLLRQGKEVPRLCHRDHEHDPARHRSAQHHPHQHPRRKPRRRAGEGPLQHHRRQSALLGGKERKEVQQNFPIRTGETAFLFLQHFIKILKAGGRAGIVIKNTFLFNTDNASVSLRQKLLEECNLHSVLDCPGGTFIGAGVKTVVLFFEKGTKTRKVWFSQLDPGRNMGKTNPLNDTDLAEFIALQKTQADSPKSWSA